jgi:hypothetical protein
VLDFMTLAIVDTPLESQIGNIDEIFPGNMIRDFIRQGEPAGPSPNHIIFHPAIRTTNKPVCLIENYWGSAGRATLLNN